MTVSADNIIDFLRAKRVRNSDPEVWSIQADNVMSADEGDGYIKVRALIAHIDDPRHDAIVKEGREIQRLVLTSSTKDLPYVTSIVMTTVAEMYGAEIDDEDLAVAGSMPDALYTEIVDHLRGVNAALHVIDLLDGDPDDDEDEEN